jgi:deoxyadenosine/deoxycytidine kinase
MLEKLEPYLKNVNVVYLPEPVHLWKDFCNVNLLQQFYASPKETAFLFQNYVLQTLLTRQKGMGKMDLIIMERSWQSSHIFIELLFRNNMLSKVEKEILNNWEKFLTDAYPELQPQASVFLDVKPAIALERIRIRQRKEETDISLEYLSSLGELHEEIFGKRANNILMIDCNAPLSQMDNEYPRVADWIISQMQKHQQRQ